jgi:hypothetical protein
MGDEVGQQTFGSQEALVDSCRLELLLHPAKLPLESDVLSILTLLLRLIREAFLQLRNLSLQTLDQLLGLRRKTTLHAWELRRTTRGITLVGRLLSIQHRFEMIEVQVRQTRDPPLSEHASGPHPHSYRVRFELLRELREPLDTLGRVVLEWSVALLELGHIPLDSLSVRLDVSPRIIGYVREVLLAEIWCPLPRWPLARCSRLWH